MSEKTKKRGKMVCGVWHDEAPGETREEQLRYIVASSTAHIVEGQIVDLFTASAVVNVLDRLNEENKAKLLGVRSIVRMVNIVWAVLEKKSA